MLFLKAVNPSTLELLRKLQKLPELSGMRLVGGTALALQTGHRKSDDIDLFGNLDTDELDLNKKLGELAPVRLIKNSANIHIYLIGGIKVDIVNYHYPWLEGPVHENSLLLAGEKDIAAMKLSAVTGRGSRKDFIDIYYLLKKFSFEDMMNFYKKKYYDGSEFLVLKSVIYFNDADAEQDPVMLKTLEWNKVKSAILRQAERYINK